MGHVRHIASIFYTPMILFFIVEYLICKFSVFLWLFRGVLTIGYMYASFDILPSAEI